MGQTSLQFDDIVHENKDKVFNLLFRLTGDYHLSEDLFQETFIKIYKGLGNFKEKSKLSTWIYTIALNVFKDYVRKKKWKWIKNSEEQNRVDGQSDESNNPEILFFRKKEKESVQKLIGSLNKSLRIPLVLYYIAGLPIDQIAMATKKTKSAIKVSLHRARKLLRKELDDA